MTTTITISDKVKTLIDLRIKNIEEKTGIKLDYSLYLFKVLSHNMIAEDAIVNSIQNEFETPIKDYEESILNAVLEEVEEERKESQK